MSLSRYWSTRCAICAALALALGSLLFWIYSLAATSLALHLPRSDSEANEQSLFTRDDGLAANSVTALVRDDTSLWIGTTAGLNRYTLKGRDAGLAWQTYTSDDGMAADAVSDLWTDDAGNLWVTHPDRRISVFDRANWTTYDSPTQTLEQAYKQIVDNNVSGPWWSIEEGGRVWTLAEDTVGYYVGAVWRPYGTDAGIPAGRLVAVWAGDGAWVAAENGRIGYFDGATWTTFRDVFDVVQRQYETIVASGPAVGPLWVVDQEGAIWVRNAFNQRNPRPDVRRFAEGRWTNFSSANGMATGFVAELRLDEYGRIWARHVADANGQGGGLSLYAGEWSAIIPPLGGNVTDFWPAGTDGVWIGNAYQPPEGGVPVGGLTYVALDTWQRFSLAELGGAAVSDVWRDEQDNLWLGLTSDARRGLPGGLLRYRPSRSIQPAQWTQSSGLLDDDVRDLWGDGQGNLWVATAGGVNHIALQGNRRLSYTVPIPDRLAGDGEGNVWAVAWDEPGRVWQWDGSAWASHTVSEGLGGGSYADLLVSTDGHVYLASDRGLDIWDGDAWETFAALPGRHTKRIWQDALGDLWLSSEITPGRPFNLSLYRGYEWQTVLNESASREMGPEPLALWRDSRGRAWLGAPWGLFVCEPDGEARWHSLGPVEGLPAGPVPSIYEDAGGTVWVAIGNQVYRSEGQDWLRFEPQVGIVSRISAGPAGSTLFAGDAGVALYHPISPDLRLKSIVNLMTGEVTDGREAVVLTLGRNAMRVDLAAIAPTLTSRQLSYRYRLEGFDDEWRVLPARSWGDKQVSITYAGLPGGVYTFTAAARTNMLNYGPQVGFTLYVVSRPPQLVLDQVTTRAYVEQPIHVRWSSSDDQLGPLTYSYRIEGLSDNWTATTRSEISFTLSVAGTYTLVAKAVDSEEQASLPVSAQIVVRARGQVQRSDRLPVGTIAAGMGVLSALLIGAAIFLIFKRKRRESW